MDAIKQAFEAQFGTEWSQPVIQPEKEETNDEQTTNNKNNNSESGISESEFESESEHNSSDDEPITIRHEETNQEMPRMTKSQRRRFMAASGPKDDTEAYIEKPKTKEDSLDLENDLALQRLIDESHILNTKRDFTGADISGGADPLENAGKQRVKIMQHRLAKAGAKISKPRIPQAMAVGIRNKASERQSKVKEEAKEAGIILAREKHEKSKNRFRDKGLKINSVGKASEYGIHLSNKDIAQVTGKSNSKPRFKNSKRR